jgi:hypothetical protein
MQPSRPGPSPRRRRARPRGALAAPPRRPTVRATSGAARQPIREGSLSCWHADRSCGPHCRVARSRWAPQSSRAWLEVELPPRLGAAPSTAARSPHRAWPELPPQPSGVPAAPGRSFLYGRRPEHESAVTRCKLREWRGAGDRAARCWGRARGAARCRRGVKEGVGRKRGGGWGRNRETGGKGNKRSDSLTDGSHIVGAECRPNTNQ